MVYSLLPVLGILDFLSRTGFYEEPPVLILKKMNSGSRFYSSKNNSRVDSENQIQFQVT